MVNYIDMEWTEEQKAFEAKYHQKIVKVSKDWAPAMGGEDMIGICTAALFEWEADGKTILCISPSGTLPLYNFYIPKEGFNDHIKFFTVVE